jgi:parallel beta-helix repeat protein
MVRHLLLTLLCLAITLPASSAFAADCNDNGIDDAWETSPMGPDDAAGLYFPGSNTQYAMLDPMTGMPGEAFTISLWMRTANPEPAGLLSYIIPGDQGLLLFLVSNDTQLSVCGRTLDTSLDLATDAWIHLAVTWESTTGELIVYLDGVLAYTGTITHPDTLTDGGSLVLGQDQEASTGGFHPDRAFDGQMNEVRIWDHARSQNDIASDRLTPLQGDELGLVAYWKMDEGIGAVLTDEVAGQNMTLLDATWVPYTDANGDGLPDDCIAATNLTQGTVHGVIQEAINLASHGDEIVVHPGEHFENLNLHGKQIVLRSEDPTDPGTVVSTIINGGGNASVITCTSGETVDTRISGFVITGGDAYYGGGMYAWESSPTVSNCTFTNNSAYYGGGLFVYVSSATVSNCTFTNNSADGGGGGMHVRYSSPTVSNCTFTNNSADEGGGMYFLSSSPIVSNCVFSNHSVFVSGAGIHAVQCSLALSNCTFTGNSTEQGSGGGVCIDRSSLTATDCTFTDNSAGNHGGGMYFVDGLPSTVTNSIICGNIPNQIEGDYIDGGGNTISIYIPPPPTPPTDPCPEDINGDGVVDQQDLGALLAVYGQNCP